MGLVIVGGWYVTGHIGHVAEDPETLEEMFVATNTRRPESFSYVGPVAYSLELLLLWTDKSLKVTFGVAIVAGLLVGALAYALWARTFRWESFASAADLRNHVVGGVLMGFGGVTALGCTDRPGPHRRLDARARLLPGARFDHRRRRGDQQGALLAHAAGERESPAQLAAINAAPRTLWNEAHYPGGRWFQPGEARGKAIPSRQYKKIRRPASCVGASADRAG